MKLTSPLPLYGDYVYQDGESIHSGIGANVYILDPEYNATLEQRLAAMNHLSKYASESIMAYRAIEWWSHTLDIFQELTLLGRDLLTNIEKPKTYRAATLIVKEVVD